MSKKQLAELAAKSLELAARGAARSSAEVAPKTLELARHGQKVATLAANSERAVGSFAEGLAARARSTKTTMPQPRTFQRAKTGQGRFNPAEHPELFSQQARDATTLASAGSLVRSIKTPNPARHFTKGANSGGGEENTKISPEEAEKHYSAIEEQINQHPLIAGENEFFSQILTEIAKNGAPQEVMKIIIENYRARTMGTVKAVGVAFTKALEQGDVSTAKAFGQNLVEELGEGGPMHIELMERCFQKMAKLFNISLTPIKQIQDSPELVAATLRFSQRQSQALASDNHPYTVGWIAAHEAFASIMMTSFRDNLIKPFEGHFTPEEFKEMMQYYSVHLDPKPGEKVSVEEDHYLQARRAAVQMFAKNPEGIDSFANGASSNLSAQSKMFEKIAEACRAEEIILRSQQKYFAIKPKSAQQRDEEAATQDAAVDKQKGPATDTQKMSVEKLSPISHENTQIPT